MAAVEIEVPVQIEILVPAQASEPLGLAAQVPLHFAEGFPRVDHRKAALALQPQDSFINLDQLVGFVAHQAGIAEAQVAGRQVLKRVAERATGEAQLGQEPGQLLIIVDEPAGGNAGGRLNSQFPKYPVGPGNLAADFRQAAVLLVPGRVVGVDRHDHAGQAVFGQRAHVFVGPERSIGADHGMDAALGGVPCHRAEILVDQRLAADEQQVADMVFDADIDDVPGLGEGYAAALFGVEPIDGETAEIAFGVADVGDGKLQIARPAVIQDIFEKPEGGGWGTADGRQRLNAGRAGEDRRCR